MYDGVSSPGDFRGSPFTSTTVLSVGIYRIIASKNDRYLCTPGARLIISGRGKGRGLTLWACPIWVHHIRVTRLGSEWQCTSFRSLTADGERN